MPVLQYFVWPCSVYKGVVAPADGIDRGCQRWLRGLVRQPHDRGTLDVLDLRRGHSWASNSSRIGPRGNLSFLMMFLALSWFESQLDCLCQLKEQTEIACGLPCSVRLREGLDRTRLGSPGRRWEGSHHTLQLRHKPPWPNWRWKHHLQSLGAPRVCPLAWHSEGLLLQEP